VLLANDDPTLLTSYHPIQRRNERRTQVSLQSDSPLLRPPTPSRRSMLTPSSSTNRPTTAPDLSPAQSTSSTSLSLSLPLTPPPPTHSTHRTTSKPSISHAHNPHSSSRSPSQPPRSRCLLTPSWWTGYGIEIGKPVTETTKTTKTTDRYQRQRQHHARTNDGGCLAVAV
jgi:hypothetical protein